MEQKEVKQVKQEIEWSAGFFPPNAGGDISIEEVCQRLGEQLLNTCEVLWQIQNTIDTVEKEIDTLQDQLTPLKKQYTQFLELATRYHYLPPGDKLQANEKGIGTQAWYEMFDSISAQMIPLEENISSKQKILRELNEERITHKTVLMYLQEQIVIFELEQKSNTTVENLAPLPPRDPISTSEVFRL